MTGVRVRESIVLLCGAAAAIWATSVDARPRTIPVVGVLYAGTSKGSSPTSWSAFRQGIRDAGFVEGRDLTFDFRFAENNPDLLTQLAADLVQRRVAVIVIPGSSAAVRAAMAATKTIPIVFMNASDPVRAGLVSSFPRPGGNVTGITDMGGELAAKRLGLLHQLVPEASRIGALIDPNTVRLLDELRTAAKAAGLEIEAVTANTDAEIDTAFKALGQKQVQALWVSPGSLFLNRRDQIINLAAHYALPAIYPLREFAEHGGLISYGSNIADRSQQAGQYVGRILKGEKPGNLPIMRNTKFDLVINLRTARTLGLKVPVTLHSEANEVFE
jgi:putative tryptophan/tyrosine transport system substrate-binding protein